MIESQYPKRITDFALSTGWLYNDAGKAVGSKLLICNEEYEAWLYDSYIFDAIRIAAKWQADQVTFERICHLRYWLRENIQHGHNLPYNRLRSIHSVKKFIDKLIDREYGDDILELKESKAEATRQNNEMFQS